MKARNRVDKIVVPIGKALSRVGISPSMVTMAGLLVTVFGAVIIAAGHLVAGVLVAAFGSLLDTVDGPLARVTGRVTKRGALLDTMADRVGEVAIWTGIAYFVGFEPRLATLAVVALSGSLLVPYVRSKAEGMGTQGKGGLMGRAERLIVLLTGTGLEGLGLDSMEPTLWILAVATWLTVGQRAASAWRQLGE